MAGAQGFMTAGTPACASRATTTNPKDLFGAVKFSPTVVPPCAIAYEARAMYDGVRKYGPYNWRDKAVQARIYLDACRRHLDLWFEGEEIAADSGAPHLGHARACLGILIDAKESGQLIDDRPITPGALAAYAALTARFNAEIKTLGS